MQARQYLKDQKKFFYLADPQLHGHFPRRCLNYAIAITTMCLNEEATFRPLISDIVVALDYLAAQAESPSSRNNAGACSEHPSAREVSRRSHSRRNSS